MITLFRFLLRSSRWAVPAAVICGVVSGLAGVGVIALIPETLHAAPGRLPTLAAGYVALCLLTVAARLAAQSAMIRIAQGTVAGLVQHLCRRILALPLKGFEANDPGGMLAVLTEDVAVLTNALAGLPLVCINLTVVSGCFAYLGFLSPALLGCTIAFSAPAILSHQLIARRGRRLVARARAEQDALSGHFHALIEGFKELKLHRERREAFLSQSVREASIRVRDANTAGLSVFAVLTGWGQLLYLGFLGFTAFVLPALVNLPAGSRSAAVLTMVYAISPLDGLFNWVPILVRAGASMARIEALGLSLDRDDVVDEASGLGLVGTTDLGPFCEALELREVTYAYEGEGGGEGFRLGPLNLTVYPGEILFLVGGNGSGKTTLLKLLTGLYPPDSGEIVFDGQVISAGDLDAYRQRFTVVFADGFLFPTLLGLDGDGLDDRAREWLFDLGLEGRVRVTDGAFSTTKLSQGQRKRLALLAACLEDRPVLVLDEWASHQDPPFKKAFYLEILPALKARGKTLVVISHDEEFYDSADRVVHLTAGSLSGSTTFPSFGGPSHNQGGPADPLALPPSFST